MILPSMTLKEYHSKYPNLPSPSVLSEALKSPAHLAWYLQNPPKTSDEYNFGTLIHEFVENGFKIPKTYTEVPELYKKASGDNVAGDPKRDDDGDPKFTFTCEDPEKSLTPSHSKKAKVVMDGLAKCKEVLGLFKGKGKIIVEQSMTGVIDGVEVKCRPDILIELEDKVIVLELKTTRHTLVDLVSFSRDFFDFNYDMQCVFETEITQQNYKNKPVEPWVLAVSTDMPSGAALVDMPETLIATGKAKIADALAVWKTKPTKTFYYNRGTLELSYMATNYRVKKGIE